MGSLLTIHKAYKKTAARLSLNYMYYFLHYMYNLFGLMSKIIQIQVRQFI